MVKLLAGDEAPVFSASDLNGESFSLEDYRGKSSVVLIFLRYVGCPLCRRYIAEMASREPDFKAAGAEVIVVVQSGMKDIRKYSPVKAPPYRMVPDPDARLYAMYGVERVSPLKMMKPEVALGAIRAMAAGYGHAPMIGDELRAPGVFIIDKNGRLLLSHTGDHIADVPDPREILDNIKE